MRVRLAGLTVATLLLATTASACGNESDGTSATGSDSGGSTTLTVFAAASLTATFQQIADEFESEHPGVRVDLDFAGSSDLVSQIQQGAPADVFASADEANMDKVTDGDLEDGDPQAFATNTLEIATPPGNPAGVTSFADLGKSGLAVVVCAPEVPCGSAATQMEQVTGVRISPVSEEQSVTDVLAKVSSGEADAGLVYVTDVTAAGDDVTGVTFPESNRVVNTYPIVALKDADDHALADDFVKLVLSEKGQSILADAGFGKP